MEKTKIQWTDYSWNPWMGCTKVSPGCKYCYMYRDKERYGQDPTIVVETSKSTFNKPLHLEDPSMIFTCSWSDFFIEDADEWRSKAWEIIKKTPQHVYQILTKRPERIGKCLPDDWNEGYDNVWLGVSVESDKYLKRIDKLIKIPAKVRFLSVEPLLAPIKLIEKTDIDWSKIHWVIVGGESGNDFGKYKYRECKLDWLQAIVADCQTLEIPVFVKQLGTYLAKRMGMNGSGGDFDEFPEYLKFREYPKTI
jgi:protein gp37